MEEAEKLEPSDHAPVVKSAHWPVKLSAITDRLNAETGRASAEVRRYLDATQTKSAPAEARAQ